MRRRLRTADRSRADKFNFLQCACRAIFPSYGTRKQFCCASLWLTRCFAQAYHRCRSIRDHWEDMMTRLTLHVAFARRFFRNSLLVGLGSALFCSGAIAQTKGSPDHIKAATSAVDSASIKANTATSNDWPTIGLDYAETRFSKLNKINTD